MAHAGSGDCVLGGGTTAAGLVDQVPTVFVGIIAAAHPSTVNFYLKFS